MPDLSRRHIVTAAAALPPLALPAAVLPAAALPPAAVRSAIDREAMAIRAKQIVDVLGRCYVREGWKLNTERAAQFVESVRTFDGERERGRLLRQIRDGPRLDGRSRTIAGLAIYWSH
jgi:hypothetical protein